MVVDREIPNGFQKTEVGIIPSDWLLPNYGEIFDFLVTATYSRAQLTFSDEIKYVHYGDIHTKCENFLDCDKVELPTIKKELLRNYPLLKEGDLIVVDASEDYDGISKSVEVRNIRNKKIISGLHTFLLRAKKDNIVNGIKGYIHSNNLVKKQMDTLATGIKVYGVSKTNLKKIIIPLPPTKAEQTAIATALNDADKLITEFEKLIAKKKLIKQGAMQELLRPKPGWQIKKFKEVISFIIDNRGKTPPLAKQGKPLIEVNAIYNQGKSPNYKVVQKFVSQNIYNSWFRDGNPKRGDILVVTVGSAGVTSYVLDEIGSIAQNIIALRTKEEYCSEFLYYFTLSRYFANQVSSVLMGAVQPSLKVPHLEKFIVELPINLNEQNQIAQILSNMDSEIELLEKKLDKYKMLKQGMMQNLLTGKIRLI